MSTYSEIIAKCAKDWGCPDLMESVNKVGGKKIPFSSPSLNWATYGGVPRAALSEFYGYPGGHGNGGRGKTGKILIDGMDDFRLRSHGLQSLFLLQRLPHFGFRCLFRGFQGFSCHVSPH